MGGVSVQPTDQELAVLRAFGMRPRTDPYFIAEVQHMAVEDVEKTIEFWAKGDPGTALTVVAEYESPRGQWTRVTPPPAPLPPPPVLVVAVPEPPVAPKPPVAKATPKKRTAAKPLTKTAAPKKKTTASPVSLSEDETPMDSVPELTPKPEPVPAAVPDPEPTPEPATPTDETPSPALVVATVPPAEPNAEETTETIETLLTRGGESATFITRTLVAKIRTYLAELDRTLREEADEAVLTEEVSRRVSALIAEAERLQAGGLDSMARDWAQREGIRVDDGAMVPPVVKLRYLRSRS
jgi:hypothetical protein